MERQQSTIYSRLQARSSEREVRRAEAEASEMRWGAGALLALKDPDTSFIIVRVAESVDSATVDSGTKFKAFVYQFFPRSGRFRETKQQIDVSPSDVLRPVTLEADQTLPNKTLGWLFKKRPPPELQGEKDNEGGNSKSTTTSEEEEEEEEEEVDDERPSKKIRKPAPKAKKAAAKAAPKVGGKKSAPKKSKRRTEEGKEEDDQGEGIKPKKKQAALTTLKKVRTQHFPVVESPEDLNSTSNELDPNSHREAFRAAYTSNAVLFEKVINSPRHFAWISFSISPMLSHAQAPPRDIITDSPLKVILTKRLQPPN